MSEREGLSGQHDLGVAGSDETYMERAVELAQGVRTSTSPNPWVGCVIVNAAGQIVGEGATAPPGGPHAEVAALAQAGEAARGASAYVTLEPCAHYGRTPPCTAALVAAGITRVVAAIEDPDPKVSGGGLSALGSSGVAVTTGVLSATVTQQLRPYLVQRSTGRPFVVLKLATTMDGRTAAPDGSSRWITGTEARHDVHLLRGERRGARRGGDGALGRPGTHRSRRVGVGKDPQPLRVVLGHVPAGARVQPVLELGGDLGAVLDELGRRGVLQLLVEGGASVAGQLHRAGLVDRYVFYVAPAFLGGDDGRPVFAGPGVATMADAWRGRLVSARHLGEDLRIDLEPLEARGAESHAAPAHNVGEDGLAS